MSELIHKRIPLHADLADDDPCYWGPEIRAAASVVIDLPGGLLAVDDTQSPISIALFELVSSQASDGTPDTYELIMHGEGYGPPLRELRHTFWGEASNGGYIFYPSAKLICGALEALKRWFDVEG